MNFGPGVSAGAHDVAGLDRGLNVARQKDFFPPFLAFLAKTPLMRKTTVPFDRAALAGGGAAGRLETIEAFSRIAATSSARQDFMRQSISKRGFKMTHGLKTVVVTI